MPDGRRLRIRKLQIGGVSKDELLRRLAQHGVRLNEYARTLFADEAWTPAPQAREVRVAIVSLPELGLAEGGTFDEITRHAAEAGLRLCPLEVAPHLRLDHLDQSLGPYLTVASLKPRPEPAAPNGFYLRRRADGPWLRGYRADPDHVYAPAFTEFVFLLAEA